MWQASESEQEDGNGESRVLGPSFYLILKKKIKKSLWDLAAKKNYVESFPPFQTPAHA